MRDGSPTVSRATVRTSLWKCDNAALERAYLGVREEPGAAVLVTLEGRIAGRPPMEAMDPRAPDRRAIRPGLAGVPVNKVILARRHLRRPASDGRMDGKTRPAIQDSPTGLAAAALRRALHGGSRAGSVRSAKRWALRQRVGIGGEDHRPGARRRFAPGSVALSRAAGERCRRGTGGAASRGNTQSTHVERAADELR